MRLVVDGFGIKNDLRVTGTTAAVVAIVWICFKRAPYLTGFNDNTFPISTLVALVWAQIAFMSNTWYPLWLTFYRPPAILTPSNLAEIATFRGLLANEHSFAVFRDFLTQEFCVENLLFWREVEDLRQSETSILDEAEVWRLAKTIYIKFVEDGSAFEVNLPAEVAQTLKEFFAKPPPLPGTGGPIKRDEVKDARRHSTPQVELQVPTYIVNIKPYPCQDIFAVAQENIFHLMETDPYQRFRCSELYKKMVRHFELESRKHSALHFVKMI